MTSALLGKCTLITVILKEGLSPKFWLGENLGTKIPGNLLHPTKIFRKIWSVHGKKRFGLAFARARHYFAA